MNTDMAPVQEGTRARYHGSLDYMHGEYIVHGYSPADRHVSAYVDGQAYVLRKDGAKFGKASDWLANVRRTSFTVVEEPKKVANPGRTKVEGKSWKDKS